MRKSRWTEMLMVSLSESTPLPRLFPQLLTCIEKVGILSKVEIQFWETATVGQNQSGVVTPRPIVRGTYPTIVCL